MPIFYENIKGFFNFEDLYTEQVNFFSDNSNFLEIGCYYGKSTIFLSELIKEKGKNIKLHVIDTFDGYGNSEEEDNFYKIFKKNVYDSGSDEIIKIYPGKSEIEIMKFEDEFFEFIFIDGSHDYDDVKRDIQNCLKKLKKGGILSGHDWDYEPVKNAVKDTIGEKNLQFNNPVTGQRSWIYKKI